MVKTEPITNYHKQSCQTLKVLSYFIDGIIN